MDCHSDSILREEYCCFDGKESRCRNLKTECLCLSSFTEKAGSPGPCSYGVL